MDTLKHRRVVVGVDGSPNSVAALHHAAQAALRLGTDLDVVLALETRADDTKVADATRALDEVVRREFPSGLGTPWRREVERGDPAIILLRASVDAGLLVLGGREHSKADSPVGSKTVSRCVRNARCAVEVCTDQQGHAA